jgi:hypothetical protein
MSYAIDIKNIKTAAINAIIKEIILYFSIIPHSFLHL